MKTYEVLVVEPSNIYQLLIQQLLEESNYAACFCKTGGEALELVQNAEFDMLCIAMEMKDMSGIELCQKIRSLDGYLQTTQLVVITANETKSAMEKLLKAGASRVFHKHSLEKFSNFLEKITSEQGIEPPLSGRILYIEDNRAESSLIGAILSERGFIVDHFLNAEDALARFKTTAYDLVLTDVFLEGFYTGLDVVKHIRKGLFNKDVPILAISGSTNPKHKLKLLKSGANDYVGKPVIAEELLVRTQNQITTKKLFDALRKKQKHLEELAMKDHLTGLYNRHYMMDFGPRAVEQARRHKFHLSMLVVDLDLFKNINDTYGHAVGDIVLESVASTIMENLRKEDIGCRFGGEEFVVILPHCAFSEAIKKAEIMRLAVEKSTPSKIIVTASIGVSALLLEEKTDAITDVFSRADYGTYQAKESGRNQVIGIENTPDDEKFTHHS